jgi:phage virion morphogenesis protein
MIQLTGTEAIQAKLEQLQAATGNLGPAMQGIGGAIKTRVQIGFMQGHAPDGTPWQPLKMRGGQPLRDTGRLMNSIGYQADNESAVIGTNVCYALPHQTGATINAGQPPHASICGGMTKGAKMLAWRVGGTWHRAKSVTITPRPMFPEKAMPEPWLADVLDTITAHLNVA